MQLSSFFNNQRLAKYALIFSLLSAGSTAQAGIIDLSSVTPGSIGVGAFVGTLDGNAFTASLISGSTNFSITAVGTGFGDSVINNMSPEFSDASIYSPDQLLSDKLG